MSRVIHWFGTGEPIERTIGPWSDYGAACITLTGQKQWRAIANGSLGEYPTIHMADTVGRRTLCGAWIHETILDGHQWEDDLSCARCIKVHRSHGGWLLPSE